MYGQDSQVALSGGQQFINSTSVYENSGYCAGNPPTVGFGNDWDCYRADIDNNVTCNNLEGCTWQNGSYWLGIFYDEPHCSGYLNTSYYGCGDNLEQCCRESSQFQESKYLCEAVGCNWYNISQYNTIGESSFSSPSRIWESIKFMTGFSADFSLGSEFSWIVSFVLFWIPFLAMLWAIYMSIPVIH